MYLQMVVVKFIPWDIEGLALIHKRKSQRFVYSSPPTLPLLPLLLLLPLLHLLVPFRGAIF
jgi:hypothetical protein